MIFLLFLLSLLFAACGPAKYRRRSRRGFFVKRRGPYRKRTAFR